MRYFAALICALGLVGWTGLKQGNAEGQQDSGIVAAPEARRPARTSQRWVYAHRPLQKDQDVTDLIEIARQAAAAGMNGMVLSAGFDKIDRESPAYFDRLEKVRAGLQSAGIELIPIFMSAGYGDGLDRNPNLAAGMPVNDALFVVQGKAAELLPDPASEIRNGGFESPLEGSSSGFLLSGRLGESMAIDPEVKHSGKQALRFDCSRRTKDDPGYIRQVVAVHPERCYVLRGWIRTEGMDKPRDFSLGHIRFEVRAGKDGRRLQFHDPGIPVQTDWTRFAVGFNSWGYDSVEVSIGNETSKGGRFWLDDLELVESGPVNILRRPGTPVTVRSEASGQVYEEGRDFERIEDPRLNHRFDHDAPVIRLTQGSRIKDSERLRVSWYHSAAVYQSQVSVCMSEPEIYEIWKSQVRAIHDHLKPRRYLLSMDEVRAGGSCEACVKRGISMGEIFGDCVTRQAAMIREVNPRAEIAVWSDMLDPHHNGSKNPYYLVKGDFDGSWNHIPKDLVIAIWGQKVRPESFQHFASLGFRSLGAAYYDTDNLDDVPAWLDVMRETPGVTGMMYTTWLNKYALLGEFGRLLADFKPMPGRRRN